mmetsp:Transcript_3106/g.7164  ORF Transcript_3106/g.7164 Transcript_3106/m.7164 type:complete len:326 (-) Transcript_3106:3772-4749(-)
MRLVTTSSVGPTAPPMRCSSSAMKRLTFCTFLRCFHRRDSTSHCCGVAITMSPFSSSFRSAAVSPVSITTFAPSLAPNRASQSARRSLASSPVGAMYTQRAGVLSPLAALFNTRRMANSAHTVLPLPVGAPTSALSSVLYRHWNACVWSGLKCVRRGAYSTSNPSARSADTGSGCRSSSSVGGGCFSGSSRCLKLTGMVVSEPSQLSDTRRTKYCGGSGSSSVTVNDTAWSSSALICLSRKNSWCRIISPSLSSTMIQNPCANPWTFSSHWKSGVSVRSTLSTERVMGCTCALSSTRGNWCTNLWIALPILGNRISSPISCDVRS